MDVLRVEVGVKENVKKKFVMSMLKWAGRVKRMGDEKLTKRADAGLKHGEEKKSRKTENAMCVWGGGGGGRAPKLPYGFFAPRGGLWFVGQFSSPRRPKYKSFLSLTSGRLTPDRHRKTGGGGGGGGGHNHMPAP